jgi:two-component system, NarL family, sensor histidine kinase BarA
MMNDNNKKPQLSVLVVDDNPANLTLVCEFLRDLNVNVMQASNGYHALDAFQKHPFDLVFMDIEMPEMNGIETTQKIRQLEINNQRTPIVALTAHNISEKRIELLVAGMDDCLSKPINQNQLFDVINRWAHLTTQKITTQKVDAAKKNQKINSENALQLTQTTSSNTIVDISLSLKLANNKLDLARDMLKMLLASLPQEKNDILNNLAIKNIDSVAELAHKLYGSSCYCGVPKLKEVSSKIDKLFQHKKIQEALDALPELIEVIDELILWSKNKDIDQFFC